jgi:hypothetical protein
MIVTVTSDMSHSQLRYMLLTLHQLTYYIIGTCAHVSAVAALTDEYSAAAMHKLNTLLTQVYDTTAL